MFRFELRNQGQRFFRGHHSFNHVLLRSMS